MTDRRNKLNKQQNEQILRLWVNRFEAKEIAEHFGVSVQTIHSKIRIYKAMGLPQIEVPTIEEVISRMVEDANG